MFIPLRTDVPLRRTPWVNWSLIALNVFVFMATSPIGTTWHAPWAFYHGHAIKDILALDPQNPHLYQYFTCQFLHADWLHILGNMLFLYIFGNNINDRMGHIGYLAFYLAGGVFAGIGYAAFDIAPCIGASGAIAAVTGAYLILLPRSHITVFYFLFILIGAAEIPGLWFVLFFFCLDIVYQFVPGFAGTQPIAHMAHISGTLFGIAVCLSLLAVQLLPRDQFDILAMFQRWNRRRQFRSMVNQGYNPFDYVQPVSRSIQRPPEPNPIQLRILELRAEISEAIAHHNLQHAAIQFLELKKLDPSQVLSRQAHLDVANQLASQQFYTQAAEAYEQFLHHYPNFDQIEQVRLMLGMIYARYLNNYPRARQLLLQALSKLHTEREINLARAELTRIEPLIPATPPTNI